MPDRPELYRETTKSGGSLVYYGAATNGNQRRDWGNMFDLSKRCIINCPPPTCKDNEPPSCDSKHNGARNELCDKLLAELEGNGDVTLPQKPRQICYIDGKACCVSWNKKLSDKLVKADLYQIANKVIKKCTSNGISGKTQATIQGVCTNVCVSSRGTHCS
ncbi:hypothetical protein DM02DRAFT_664549 [Periconia macrospinosa]|uniref:WD-like domain-containing protein n=1 Tax=Periconia macrospinosa TaxID=97972 RepID=A0A2V1CYU2_9PLEO|nr:hypothetical protein DM02DRAFT_664549 [Periconia macrospinosa]